uniref:Uncharacterized protein n=1 Tax=Arundo donax TaxID=35708 RepID=A0A0A9EVM1_ARUDO
MRRFPEVVRRGGEEGGGPRGIPGPDELRGERGGEGAGRVGLDGAKYGRPAAATEGHECRVVGVQRRRAVRGGRPVLLPPQFPDQTVHVRRTQRLVTDSILATP